MAFRVFGGFAAGVASVVAPMYITEISPTRQRGVLGSLQQLGIVLGIFVSLLVNALLKDHWGRARPNETTLFGGDGAFSGPFVIAGQCARNCSFVSGEGAGAREA